ncbi:MAG: glycosyltransferase [Thermodesulfobacteriota bacterium]
MSNDRLRIIKACTYDCHGGAARDCWQLFSGYRERGHDAYIAAGRKLSYDPHVFQLHPDGPAIETPFAQDDLCTEEERAARRRDVADGLEDFCFPASRRMLDLLPGPADVAHFHNLHGGYFDLAWLPGLSARMPVVLTLHDAWLLAGNCAHSFACERWLTGCGQCPNIHIYPGLKADGTAANLARKRDIYRKSRLRIATPCRWLMDKVERSALAEGMVEGRVIPYGLNQPLFRPRDRREARRLLGLPEDGLIFLFSADNIRNNLWKDFKTLREAVGQFATQGREVLFVALGETAPEERMERVVVRFVPFERDTARVAAFFQAADIYLHAAKADTFPQVVLEALACGTPVVGTAVGGIPEQVKGLAGLPGADPKATWGRSEATGALTPGGDAAAMARTLSALAGDPQLLAQLSGNAASDAAQRFDIGREVGDYLAWFAEMREQDRQPSNRGRRTP